MTDPTIIIITAGLLLAALTVLLVRRLSPTEPIAAPRLFGPPEPPVLVVAPQPDEFCLITKIGEVVSHGMDRVDAMRQFGADRFLTFMPMPDGTCWSLTVVHHPNEATAKASYRPAPLVTH
jgi:hypothetical protein